MKQKKYEYTLTDSEYVFTISKRMKTKGYSVWLKFIS